MDRPVYLNVSRLRETLGHTWFLFQKYWDLDLIPTPDATAGEKPLWLISRVDEIRERINEFERRKTAAKFNAEISV
jgi:hypothetical protein